MIYYIDRENGCGDGMSAASPRRDYRDLLLLPGDRVLFRRGTKMRERLDVTSGEKNAPITYGSYGEGELPCFVGSVSLNRTSDWEEIRPCVWRSVNRPDTEACNFIYDEGRSCGTLRWSLDELISQGDFFDECFGFTAKRVPCDGSLYLYSHGNPADYYDSIECAVHGGRNLADAKRDVILENLAFENSGVHGFSGKGIRTSVIGCRFRFIGGCVWDLKSKIRFGNAVEFWNVAEDVRVENCIFDNIYDSCVTHQGGAECQPAVHVYMTKNSFSSYGMAAYECRDILPIDTLFSDNICRDAGGGFSALEQTIPRNSEIYPEPMGHHIFIWRIPKATEGGSLLIERNLFADAFQGAAIYSIISSEAEAQITIRNNIYRMHQRNFYCRFGGKNYDDFAEYQRDTGCDMNSVCEDTDSK